MRLLWVLTAVYFVGVANAYAYLETYSEDETQVAAGEQNTNLYRLNAKRTMAVKKLKKIDEAIARNPSEKVMGGDISAIEEMIDSQENENKQALEMMMKKISQTLSHPADLKAAPDNDLYRRFAALGAQDVRDYSVATALRQKLKGGRR